MATKKSPIKLIDNKREVKFAPSGQEKYLQLQKKTSKNLKRDFYNILEIKTLVKHIFLGYAFCSTDFSKQFNFWGLHEHKLSEFHWSNFHWSCECSLSK